MTSVSSSAPPPARACAIMPSMILAARRPCSWLFCPFAEPYPFTTGAARSLSSSIAFSTRSRVDAFTTPLSFNTAETVALETAASRATSPIVARFV